LQVRSQPLLSFLTSNALVSSSLSDVHSQSIQQTPGIFFLNLYILVLVILSRPKSTSLAKQHRMIGPRGCPLTILDTVFPLQAISSPASWTTSTEQKVADLSTGDKTSIVAFGTRLYLFPAIAADQPDLGTNQIGRHSISFQFESALRRFNRFSSLANQISWSSDFSFLRIVSPMSRVV
jgi:hypothetical protein